ncbi:MAG: UDP-glucose 4-epimerase GalE [Actinomycetota bacterium]
MNRNVLVTGGAGYIGSHTTVSLLDAGDDVVIYDDLSNSSPHAIEAIEAIAGRAPTFVQGDVRDEAALGKLFAEHPIDAVVHCAAKKAVGESVELPVLYWDVNVGGTMKLLAAMTDAGVVDLVFSSSATVYAEDAPRPLVEDSPLGPTNPYGSTKFVVERLLADVAPAGEWRFTSLRYFNPVGAHPSGDLGEDPRGIPNNLMPRILHFATQDQPSITIYGDDWPTPDGTGVRDYLHVVDLAEAHLAALDARPEPGTHRAINVGTGQGVSVLELVAGVERASGVTFERIVQERRPGDVAASFATVDHAVEVLGWRATRGLDDMCADSWRWFERHPQGFAG